MIELFQIINTIVHTDSGEFTDEYCHFVNNELVYNDDEKEQLPIPVFSYIAPTMKTSFILHFMLSEGHFETEIDLLLHPSVKECLRYCKLIGPHDDEDSLIEYANNLTRKYIEEQVQFFPNTQRVIDYWIITAHEIFYKIVVDNDLPIDEMPAVQLSTLITEQEDEMKKLNDQLKSSLIDAALNEIGITTALCCNIPSKFELMNATLEAPVVWDPVSSYRRNPVQSQESYEEQCFAIKTCIDTINEYCNIMTSTSYTKNIGIRGIPGSGKTFCNLYCMLYIISLGLKCNATSMMCKRALQLGGIHVHQTWPIPTEKHLTPHRRAELALTRLLKDPIKMNFLRSLNVIFFDEMGQCSAEMLATFDIIMRQVRNSNIFMGGVLLLFSIDHSQIQPIEGRPFLISCHVIPCFRMISLDHSVRAANDDAFKRIQQIARYTYNKLLDEPDLIEEFINLCSNNFTFVESWEDEKILPSTMRLYSKKVPANDASRQFIERVRRFIPDSHRASQVSEDVQKSRYSHQDWHVATEQTSSQLEQRLKEPHELLFFKGAVYELTFNSKGEFSNTQLVILYDLPNNDQLSNWKKIKVLKAPVGQKEISFDLNLSKEDFFFQGFEEIEIGVAPQRTQFLSGNIQAKRKQY